MNLDTGVENDDALTGLEPEAEAVEAVERADTERSSEVMSLLAEGVPLALLADLANPDGPASPAILEDEGLPEVAWWDADEAGVPDATEDAGAGDDDGGSRTV